MYLAKSFVRESGIAGSIVPSLRADISTSSGNREFGAAISVEKMALAAPNLLDSDT